MVKSMKQIIRAIFNAARSLMIAVIPGVFDRLFYLISLRRRCNLKTPMRFSEKLIWLKRYWRDPRAYVCADKYAARQYLQDRGFGDLLIPLIAVYSSVEEFNFDELPEQFALKAAHGSYMNIICRDKSKASRSEITSKVKQWLKTNFYHHYAEYPYSAMPRRVVCEQLMTEPGQQSLTEYKIICCNSVPNLIMVYYGREGGDAYTCCYDLEWNKLPVYSGKYTKAEAVLPRPQLLEYMLEIAGELSSGFPFMRVDLYEICGKVYFGEMTFFPNAGVCSFIPDEYDLIVGSKLTLPNRI
ncbi:MAG: hypothetical protein FWE49_00740 [Synergistaceae bacterium]|nr:hypothetical protein [Synergistaceae bacterium]